MPTCDELVKRIEKEAVETLSKTASLLVNEVPSGDIAGKNIQDPKADPTSEHGAVDKNVNNPEAQVWGIGKSKL